MNLSCLSGSLVLQSIFYLPAPETVFLGDLERWPQTGLTRYRGPLRIPSSTFSSDLQGRYTGNRPQRTPAQLRAQARAGGVGSWLEPVPSSCRRPGDLLQGRNQTCGLQPLPGDPDLCMAIGDMACSCRTSSRTRQEGREGCEGQDWRRRVSGLNKHPSGKHQNACCSIMFFCLSSCSEKEISSSFLSLSTPIILILSCFVIRLPSS